MTVSETVSDSVGEIVESTELAALFRQLSPGAACAATTRCVQKSTASWPRGQATR